jgi:phosphoglycerate dehydrogenase-like enzyme
VRALVSDVMVEEYGGRMRAVAPGIDFIQLRGDRSVDGDPSKAELVCLSPDIFARTLHGALLREMDGMHALRWFHGCFVGMDHPLFRQIAERGVTVTNAPGVSAQPIAQYVIAVMLRHAKRIPAWEAAQRERAWRRVESDELTGRTLGVIGLGGIGGEVARLARAFGMRVLGMRRQQTPVANVDVLLPPSGLRRLLEESDYLVVAAPLTEETRGLLGAREFGTMKPTAYLINVGRGPIVVEEALIAALKSGRIAGAALDVFDEEPLGAQSQLWTLDNVLITPHNSASSPRTLDRGAQGFIENLRRYAANEPLEHVVSF